MFYNFQEKYAPLRALFRTLCLLICSCENLAMWYASSTTNKLAENQVQIARKPGPNNSFRLVWFDGGRHFPRSKQIGFS